HKTMEQLKQRFPPGLDYRIVFDTTGFTRESIRAVVHTLIEAMSLVVLVVVLFLQTWRASIIPLLAVPVSLIGTFAAMAAMGFSLNNLSLFGLVLAIGIVVDEDRKSTRLNSSHVSISYAVFCLKKKKIKHHA